MKKMLLIGLLFWSVSVLAQIPTYYNGVNLTLTGMALKSELAQKITNTHTIQLQYNDVWTVLKMTDLDPTNANNVLLLYGYNDGDGNPITDKTRDKNNNGGNIGEWNREHTYAQSLATPSMTTASPNAGTDAHHLRATDVQMNGNRGNRLFATGSGNAGNAGSNWYPGDEWIGDVARMAMYMYLRYPSQCLPNNVGVGASVAVDPSMIDLFLQWNASDTVSIYEKNRNTILESEQGNRNPFIDNPYLATIIWGGVIAQDNWNMTDVNEYITLNPFDVYPVPSKDGNIHIRFNDKIKIQLIELYNLQGQQIKEKTALDFKEGDVVFTNIPKGFYILKALVDSQTITKKVIIE
jgi:endonuclease I